MLIKIGHVLWIKNTQLKTRHWPVDTTTISSMVKHIHRPNLSIHFHINEY